MLRLSFAILAAGLALPAFAADPGGIGYVHLGASVVKQQDDARLYVLGTPVAGAGFQTQLGYTGSVEAGVFLRDGFAIAASAMWPTTTPNIATGTIAGLGNLGDETVGFYSATAQYHAAVTDELSLYGGAGIGYMHVFDTVDGAVTDMAVANALGAVLQVGIDYKIADNIGVFADVKRYFISTTASGTLNGAAITADARVDPWVVSTGIGVSF
jgi:outer membrane protein W